MNFCSPSLHPKVRCEKPSTDGYEVENLITDIKQSGFKVEYFIRAPVDIVWEFIVPIHISHIFLHTSVNQNVTNGFSIYTNHNQTDNSEEVSLCVGNFFTAGEKSALLKNHYYKHWMTAPLPNFQTEDTFTGSLKNPNREALKKVKILTIRLSKSTERRPLALGHVEIWGQPAISTSSVDRKHVLQLWMNRKYKPESTLPSSFYQSNSDKVLSSVERNPPLNKSSSMKLDEIPEDFLDPLTCEIMSIPLLLPSGKSVDNYTLERFIENEARWGRPASDPFTGVPFKPNRKPTPNVALKARIDRYLLLDSNHSNLTGLGQSVGSVSYLRKIPEEDIVHSSKAKTKSGVCNHTPDDKDLDSVLAKLPSYLPEVIPTCLSSKSNSSKKSIIEDSIKPVNFRRPRTSNNQAKSDTFSIINRLSMNHNMIQTNSQNGSKRQKINHDPDDKPPDIIKHTNYVVNFFENSTEKCNCKSIDNLYKLKCIHLICRICLNKQMKNNQIVCDICSHTSLRKDIHKHNSKSIFSSI